MTTEEIIVAVVAAVLVVFSLIVSMVVPKRDPNFPGKRHLLPFALVVMVIVGGTLATIEMFGFHEEESEAAVEGHGGTPAEGEPAPAAPAEPAPAAEAPAGDPAAGKELFASAGCASCHTLADAGASGQVGPNLDELAPSYQASVEILTNGRGAMPPFAQLGEDGIANVAAYVVEATSG